MERQTLAASTLGVSLGRGDILSGLRAWRLAEWLIVAACAMERPFILIQIQRLFGTPDLIKNIALAMLVLTSWLLIVLLYLYAARCRGVLKWALFAALTLSSMLADFFYVVSGHALMYSDYIVLQHALSNTTDALAEYATASPYTLLRHTMLLAGFCLMPPASRAAPKALAMLLISVALVTAVCVAKKGAVTHLLPGTVAAYGLHAATYFDRDRERQPYLYTTAMLPAQQVADRNIVLVIDESIRSDFMNGERLRAIMQSTRSPWNAYDFGPTLAGNNCSSASNLILRKGPRPSHIASDLHRHALIWSYAANAGFERYLLDAQGDGSGHNHFDKAELNMLTANIPVMSLPHDAQILDAMPFLQAPGKTFSIILKKGAHFPYSKNYPEDYVLIRTSNYIAANNERQEYAKAVEWQTERFLKKLLQLDLNMPTVVIYTSDHGQNLADQPGATHCTASSKPYKGEGLVPLIAFTNYPDADLAQSTHAHYGRLSHFNVPPTLLNYMGYRTDSAPNIFSGSMFNPGTPVSGFSYGSPFGYFGSPVMMMAVDDRQLSE